MSTLRISPLPETTTFPEVLTLLYELRVTGRVVLHMRRGSPREVEWDGVKYRMPDAGRDSDE